LAWAADDKSIGTIDESGVALAAIQGLNAKLEERLQQRDARIAALERSVAELNQRLENLEQLIQRNRWTK
jgi:uncharacterized protein YceH (UPF0502 family)